MATKHNSAVSQEVLTKKQLAQQKQAQIRAEKVSVTAAERAHQRKVVGAVAIIVAVCLALGGVLAMNAYRMELNYDILSVQNDLTEAQSVYITMQNRLDQLASEQGRDAATIGMQEASLAQMHYIDLATENKIELVGEMSAWDKIAAFFGGLF